MALDLDQPANQAVLRYLRQLGADEWVGVHPDVLDRLSALAAKLPRCVRRSIRGARVLAHRKTGAIVATAFGTAYCVRVGSAVREARRAGLVASERFLDGGWLNVSRRFGRDWLYGGWHPKEREWVEAVLLSEDP
jgi:hypothetical protein